MSNIPKNLMFVENTSMKVNLKNILLAEFLSDFKNIGIKFFRKATSYFSNSKKKWWVLLCPKKDKNVNLIFLFP